LDSEHEVEYQPRDQVEERDQETVLIEQLEQGVLSGLLAHAEQLGVYAACGILEQRDATKEKRDDPDVVYQAPAQETGQFIECHVRPPARLASLLEKLMSDIDSLNSG